VDPSRDIQIVTGPVDDLDDAAVMPSFGGKMGIDATRKLPEEGLRREWPKRLVTTEAAAKKADALWEKIKNRDVKR
jgi:4-hydroxy-3-polyprenylbenzoate decarboxylase